MLGDTPAEYSQILSFTSGCLLSAVSNEMLLACVWRTLLEEYLL